VHRDELELLVEINDPLAKFALDAIRDLYCVRGGNLPDDDRFVAGNLGITIQKWRHLKAKLVACDQIAIRAGKIECSLALAAYVEALAAMEQRSRAGIRSGEVRKERQTNKDVHGNLAAEEKEADPNKLNGLDRTTVQVPFEPRRMRRTKRRGDNDAVSISDALRHEDAPAVGRALMGQLKPTS
jgi:hypothetical protein